MTPTKRNKMFLMMSGVFLIIVIAFGCSTNETESTEDNGQSSGNNAVTNNDEDVTNNNEENTNTGGNEPQGEPDPVTLVVQNAYPDFEENFKAPIEEEFPHITIEWVQEPANEETIQELLGQGITPDIMWLDNQEHIPHYHDLDLFQNLDELIEQHNFDLSIIEPTIIDSTRSYDPDQVLRGLPFNTATYLLHYNKDIFDRFAVSYPEDGITWSEAYDLATELTREEEGVQYRGLTTDMPMPAFTQFSMNTVDPDTHEVNIVENEAYIRYMEMMYQIGTIPGNYPEEEVHMITYGVPFAEEQNVAMATFVNNIGWYHDTDGLNFDVVTYPVWEGYEGISPTSMGNTMTISKHSEHKDEAFQVLAYLISDEFQKEMTQGGHTSPSSSLDVQNAYLEDEPELQQYNIGAVHKHQPAPGPERRSPYFVQPVWDSESRYINSDLDLNEFLRMLEEEAETEVVEKMAQR